MRSLIRSSPERLVSLTGHLDTPIAQDSSSDEILLVQRALAEITLLDGAHLTGRFDDETRGALRRYQEIHQLEISGVFDFATQQAMLSWWCGNIWDSEENRSILSRVFRCVFGGEKLRAVTKSKKCRQPGTTVQIRYGFYGRPTNGPADSEMAGAMHRALETWKVEFKDRMVVDHGAVGRNEQPNLRVVFVGARNSKEHKVLGGAIARGSYPPNCHLSKRRGEILLRGFEEAVWTVDGSAGTWDLESILLHELGHLWGFPGCCTQDNAPVMRERMFKNDVTGPFPKRKPEEEDREILRDHYSVVKSS